MRLCFLVEETYRHDGMPKDVIRRLTAWGHHVDVVWPGRTLLRLSDGMQAGTHDAWVLKTVSGGPGLSLLESAAVAGLTTVNDARSIRPVRDKALAAVIAARHGLPVPTTYTATHRERFAEIPAAEYPLVVKPADGSSGRAVRLVSSPEQLLTADGDGADAGPYVAQPYVPNPGHDLKIYCVGGELHATVRRSPLHPGQPVDEGPAPLSAEVARIVREVGAVTGSTCTGWTWCWGRPARSSSTSTTSPAFAVSRTLSTGCHGPSSSLARSGSGSGSAGARPSPADDLLLTAGGTGP